MPEQGKMACQLFLMGRTFLFKVSPMMAIPEMGKKLHTRQNLLPQLHRFDQI
jgi:hypothetical protein